MKGIAKNALGQSATATLATTATVHPIETEAPLGVSADDLEGLYDSGDIARRQFEQDNKQQKGGDRWQADHDGRNWSKRLRRVAARRR